MNLEERIDKLLDIFAKLEVEDAKRQKKAPLSFQERRARLVAEQPACPSASNRGRRPKIQRVPPHLRELPEFAKYYFPKLVSIGPIHHGDERLKLGEEIKHVLTRRYIEEQEIRIDHLRTKILNDIQRLKNLYTDDVIEGIDDDALAGMLFVDGCAVLYFLKAFALNGGGLSIDEFALMFQDLVLLENQLPYDVLSLLINDDKGDQLKKSINHLLKFLHFVNPLSANDLVSLDHTIFTVEDSSHQEASAHLGAPAHLLDALYTAILNSETHPPPNNDLKTALKRSTYRNIEDLKAAGIRVTSDKNITLRNISFTSRSFFGGELKLPVLAVNNATVKCMTNLIAHEHCPDFQNNYEFCAYISFLQSLIDHPEDVKELRSAGVILNALGSDQEVAQLFNTILSANINMSPNIFMYANVRNQMEAHYSSKCNTWTAQGYSTYFSTPWTFLALLGALLALVLSFLQTWYTIYPKG